MPRELFAVLPEALRAGLAAVEDSAMVKGVDAPLSLVRLTIPLPADTVSAAAPA